MGDCYRQSLAIYRRLAPGTSQEGWSIYALGIVALNEGRYAEAEERLGEAASLQERLDPEGGMFAYALSGLALLHRSQGRLEQAAEYQVRAIEAGEGPRRRVVSATQRAGQGAFFAHFHRDLVEILAEAGRHEEAFQAMERYRARSLLAILTERDLVTPTLPDALVREREEFQLEYDRALAALKAVADKSPEETAAATTRLHRLRMQREEMAARIRSASPAATALQDPAPLAGGEAFTLLDPGTALLSYSVGSKHTVLVVLTGPPKAALRTFVIPVGAAALRERVDRLRALIASRTTRQALHEAGAALYRDLVGPAAPWVASAERVAISPDGPLHVLPFAALSQPAAPGRPFRFLAEWKPLHIVPSATVFRDLKRTRRPPRVPARVVAFGDPKYPIEALPKESPLRSRLLEPLPGSRREVDAITRLFGARARSHLDRDASERQVKGIGRDVDYLHFAVHGLVDERVPEHSALALTSSEDAERPENGLLQVWEILDEVRLDTELVTLSACDSGLGGEMPGEGIIGLTRAFLYAGSRSVVASLWAVFDNSTVTFMETFYRHLLAGRPKAEALQAAQRDTLARPGRTAPFIWAAFQVYGDWR
jgi:CHAT domain-containing protein